MLGSSIPMSYLMTSHVELRERALRLAVRTGEAVDLDFIWGYQRREGFDACFGDPKPGCPKTCRWNERCHSIANESAAVPWHSNDTPFPRLTGQPHPPGTYELPIIRNSENFELRGGPAVPARCAGGNVRPTHFKN